MLVLSRKTNETIEIPTMGITIKVVSVKGNRVNVAIAAPSDTPISRGEILGCRLANQREDQHYAVSTSMRFPAVNR